MPSAQHHRPAGHFLGNIQIPEFGKCMRQIVQGSPMLRVDGYSLLKRISGFNVYCGPTIWPNITKEKNRYEFN